MKGRGKKRHKQRTSNIVSKKDRFPVTLINGYMQRDSSIKIVTKKHFLARIQERCEQLTLKFNLADQDEYAPETYLDIEDYLERASIRYLFNDYFIVNEKYIVVIDFVKRYNKDQNKEEVQAHFVTFIGSTKENPMLFNFREYVNNQHKYGRMNLAV